MDRQPRCELREVASGWQVFFISDDGAITAMNRVDTRTAGEALLARANRALDRWDPARGSEPSGLRALLRGGPLDGSIITVPADRWSVPVLSSAYFRAPAPGDAEDTAYFDWFQ